MLIDVDGIQSEFAEHAAKFIADTLEKTQAMQAPRLIHMCGIPGAGKTTYTNFFLARNPHFALVQFDSVMEKLPGYQQALEKFGPAKAFAQFELPARVIGYHLLLSLVDNKRDIFFDHGALNRNHIGLLQGVSTRGFRLEMHYVACELDVAFERISKREQLEGRHTPRATVLERHGLLQELLPVYKELVDDFVVIEPSSYLSESTLNCTAGANKEECKG